MVFGKWKSQSEGWAVWFALLCSEGRGGVKRRWGGGKWR